MRGIEVARAVLVERDAGGVEDVEVHVGIGRGAIVPREDFHRDGPAVVVEMASDHEAVSAVVAGTAQNQHGLLLGVQLHQQFGAAPPGILHEHDAGHAEAFDRSAIEFADLLTGEIKGFHEHPAAYAARLAGIHRLMRSPPPLTTASTSSGVTQAKSPGIVCFTALSAVP